MKKFYDTNSDEMIYKGYKIISGTSDDINAAMELIYQSNYEGWNINEYLLIQNIEDNSEKEMRFDGTQFVNLRLPPSKTVKGKNALQRCALDILNNQDITVAAIIGGYGSGKSYLCTKMALYNVLDKGNQSSILLVREPVGEGKELGYLPGDFKNKNAYFEYPIEQQLDGGGFQLESLKQRGVIESIIPYFMKGLTLTSYIVICDEAEDLSDKQIRLIGTRVGENSRIFFSVDYKQSVINATENNALVKMCNIFKGNKKFGCIYLEEDVRSATSKMFANLFK